MAVVPKNVEQRLLSTFPYNYGILYSELFSLNKIIVDRRITWLLRNFADPKCGILKS